MFTFTNMQFAAITSDHSLWSSAGRKWCKGTVVDTGGGGEGGGGGNSFSSI